MSTQVVICTFTCKQEHLPNLQKFLNDTITGVHVTASSYVGYDYTYPPMCSLSLEESDLIVLKLGGEAEFHAQLSTALQLHMNEVYNERTK